MTNKSCETCIYAWPLNDGSVHCRYEPPKLFQRQQNEDFITVTVWPVVDEKAWCGKHTTYHQEQCRGGRKP